MQDPVKEVKRLAYFFNITVDDNLAKEIAKKCEFKNLKTANDTIKSFDGLQIQEDFLKTMFRKGMEIYTKYKYRFKLNFYQILKNFYRFQTSNVLYLVYEGPTYFFNNCIIFKRLRRPLCLLKMRSIKMFLYLFLF